MRCKTYTNNYAVGQALFSINYYPDWSLGITPLPTAAAVPRVVSIGFSIDSESKTLVEKGKDVSKILQTVFPYVRSVIFVFITVYSIIHHHLIFMLAFITIVN